MLDIVKRSGAVIRDRNRLCGLLVTPTDSVPNERLDADSVIVDVGPVRLST